MAFPDPQRCSMSGLLLGLAAATVLAAAPPEEKKEAAVVKEKAEEMCKLFLKGDFKKFADFTPPTIVEAAGGRDKFADFLAEGVKGMKAKGTDFRSMKVADPTDSATVG